VSGGSSDSGKSRLQLFELVEVDDHGVREADADIAHGPAEPITRLKALEILHALPETMRDTLQGLFFLIDLRDVPGGESNPRRLLRRVRQRLSRGSALSPGVLEQIENDFQSVLDVRTNNDSSAGFDMARAMIEPVLEYLPRESECFARIASFGPNVAVAFLTEQYFGGNAYHNYRMQQRILRDFLDRDFGLAALPFIAHLLVIEKPDPPTSASAAIWRLAERVARKVAGSDVRTHDLAKRCPYIDAAPNPGSA
jgi:hypothetical protein